VPGLRRNPGGYLPLVPAGRADIPAVPLVRTDQGEPTVSDRYELRSVLGSGGMGTVWEAWDRRLGRTVALKVLRDDLPPSSAARLEREARAAARIRDQRVVTVLDLDRTRDGTPYLVLECHEGRTLADELREAGGALPADRLDRLVDDLLGALAAAHECGVLHRDVKPANVLSGRDGYRVTDFGLASLDDDQTTETDLMGTLVYVAPERLEGARGSTRSDVFSAAVVLYEAASGVQPFRADDPAESISRLRNGDAPRLPEHLPLALRTALHCSLQPDPEDRPADAGELLALIRGGPAEGADPTVVLDSTAVLPAAGADDPTEDVFAARTRAVAAAEVPVEPPAEAPVEAPAARPPATPRRSVGEVLEPLARLARRHPEVAAVLAAGIAILFVLLLADAATGDGDDEPTPPPTALEADASLDDVLDRLGEIGG